MTLALPQSQPPRLKRWTKEEYNRLVERGAFDEDGHYYLFRGAIIEMSPMLARHAWAVTKGTKLLFSHFDPQQYDIRVQLPFDVPGESMPEPDLLVCTLRDGRRFPHPATAVLIIEVAETSLLHDRDKAFEYAAAKVPEYWIVDLNAGRIEVYRNPVEDATALHGYRYADPVMVKSTDTFTFLAIANSRVRACDLFA
jgi:Uma2 family endonuclease